MEPALATSSISADGSYYFMVKSIGVNVKDEVPQNALMVVVSGCSSGVYLRPITSTQNQDITSGSSLIGYAINTVQKNKMTEVLESSPGQVSSLMAILSSASSFADAYNLLISNSSATSLFTQIFGVAPSVLAQASPEIVVSSLPNQAQELNPLSMNVSVTHWDTHYQVAYKWTLDSTVIGQSANLRYTPGANAQGAHTLMVTIGENDGAGGVDTSKPTKTISQSIVIANNILPQAPSLTVTNPLVVGVTPINSRSLTVTVNTGTDLSNCASFSYLALTESAAVPDGSLYTISCSQAGAQNLATYTLTSPGDGAKTLYLWAKDASGTVSSTPSIFSFNLDTNIPTTTITTPALTLTNSASQNFAFTANDNGGVIGHFDCKIDNGAYVACSNPKSYSGLAEGDHTFSVRSTDTAGNVSTDATMTWHIDLTPPVLTLAGTPNAVTNQLTATFSLTATDSGGAGVAGYRCQMDSGTWAGCSSPYVSVLSAGTHTLRAQALDVAGNVSSIQSYSWTIDTTAPVISITSKPSVITNSQSASFSFGATDSGGGAVSSYECSLDGAGFSACTSSKNYSSLSEGSHTFQVRALDSAGNIGLPASYTWTTDLTAPVLTIGVTPGAITGSSNANFTFSATDSGGGSVASYQCKLDSSAYANCTSPVSYSGLAEGSHTFYVKVTDSAGNTSVASSYTWNINLTAPSLSITSNPQSITNQTTASFGFTATASGGSGIASYQCKLDSGSYSICSSPLSYSSLGQGSHTFYVTATDTVGNTSVAVSYTWSIDTTGPTTTLSSSPLSLTNDVNPSFSFGAIDVGGATVASFECSLDSGAYSTCVSPTSYTSLASGVHTFAVRAIDTVGNTGGSALYNWTIDTTTPIASINSRPNSITNLTTASFTFSANAPSGGSITGYQCQLDSGGFGACTSPHNYSGLGQASHTFQVKSVDNNGNISAASSYTWTVDITAPVVTIVASPASLTNATAASFTFSAVDTGGGSIASYQCKLDGGSYASCSSPQNLSALTQGSHTFSVTATDSAGNTSSPVNYTWTVDLTAPTSTIATTPSSLTNATTASFTFSAVDTGGGNVASYMCKFDGGTYSACTSPSSASSLAQGSHSFQVYAIDSAGNSGAAATNSWTVDLTAPTVGITETPLAVTNDVNPSFAFSASDTGGGTIASYSCKLDSGSYVVCSSPQSYGSLVQGAHTFYVTATDTAGNTSTAASYSWTLDTTGPVTTIATAPNSLTNSTSAGFTFSASDTGGGVVTSFNCKLDNGLYAGCSSPQNTSGLAQGSHTYSVTATDSAGNTGSAATYTWTVDLTPPTLVITASPNSITNATSASFTFSATDTGGGSIASYSCKLDSGSYSACTSGVSYSALTQGGHSFSVIATDTAGNISSAASYSWTIDTTAPTVTITANPTSPNNSTSASFSFSGSDTGGGSIASYQCKIDSGTYSTCTSAKSYSGLTEGTHTFYVQSLDTAGNTSSAASYSWVVDITAPVVAISIPSANGSVIAANSVSSFAISGSCTENGLAVNLTGSVAQSVACSGASWSANLNLSALSDGTITVNANQTDAAGNTSATATVTAIKDTTAPTISVTGLATLKGGSTTSISWSLTEPNVASSTNFSVEVFDGTTWTSVGSKAATAGANANVSYTLLSATMPSVDTTAAKIRVTVTDAAGNVGSGVSGTFIIDNTPPVLSSFTVNGGAASTTNSNIQIGFAATDSWSNISKICMQTSSTIPTSSSSCWVNAATYGLTPAQSLSTNAIYFGVGVVSGTYPIYIWLMDAVGNISTNAASTGVDKGSVVYNAPSPPLISGLQVTSTDAPSSPTTSTDLTVASGANIYVKWATSSTTGLAAGAISISYSTNDSTYTSLATGLSNAANGGCTLTGSYTGCAVLSAPTGSYFRLKLKVIDTLNFISMVSSNPMNSSSVNFLAGNTDLAIGSSAKSAVIQGSGSASLAVLDDGRIFVNDTRGLAWVNPTTGVYELLGSLTGTSSGDGGVLTSATFKSIAAIAVDSNNNLLISDSTRIRKVNTSASPMTITTIIGGGTDTSNSVAVATNYLAANNIGRLDVSPNGDIWFRGESTAGKIRKYTASTGAISTIVFSGTGNSFSTTQANTSCTYSSYYVTFDSSGNTDHLIWKMASTGSTGACIAGTTSEWQGYAQVDPATGVSFLPAPSAVYNTVYNSNTGYRDYQSFYTAKSGDVYAFTTSASATSKKIFKFNKSTLSWTALYGSGSAGTCAEGTPASSCALLPTAIALNSQGQLFYLDNMSRAIRTIDADGNVQTIAGDKLGSIDGTQPLLARFVSLNDVKWWSDGTSQYITMFDRSDSRIREFAVGGTLTTLAGNQVSGNPAAGSTAATSSLQTIADANINRFMVNSVGDIYYARNGSSVLSRIVRATGKWTDVSSSFGYGPQPMAIGNGYLLASSYNLVSNVTSNASIYVTNISTNAVTKIIYPATNTALAAAYCAAGTTLAGSCNASTYGSSTNIQGYYDTATNSWIAHEANGTRFVTYGLTGGGTMQNLTAYVPASSTYIQFVTAHAVVGFDANRSADLTTNYIYTCATDNKLYKYNLNNSGAETNLPMPVTSMKCSGPVYYSATRGSLIFSFTQNSLYGVAEYLNP
ncbi:MAG: hypothetical protein J7501_06570 [Bdellovibrio sp.]|nr:hypothetical protein [Bdellovibrio sp.]